MFIGKDLVIVGGETKGSYTSAEFPRVYFENAANDATENYTKTTEGKEARVGSQDESNPVFNGIRPKGFTTTNPATLVQDAVNACKADAENWPEYAALTGEVKENVGWLVLLQRASIGKYFDDAKLARKAITAPAVQDPAVALAKSAKAMVAEYASRGKTITVEKALSIIERMRQIEEAEEAAA